MKPTTMGDRQVKQGEATYGEVICDTGRYGKMTDEEIERDRLIRKEQSQMAKIAWQRDALTVLQSHATFQDILVQIIKLQHSIESNMEATNKLVETLKRVSDRINP